MNDTSGLTELKFEGKLTDDFEKDVMYYEIYN